MTEQLKQLPISEKEENLLKGTFKNNEYLLKAIRALFFGFEVSEADKELIKKTFSSKELTQAFRKKIFPILSNENEIGQFTDFWANVETQLMGKDRDTIYQVISYKDLLWQMLNQAIALLNDPNGEKIDIAKAHDSLMSDPLQTKLIARTLYVKTIETGLLFVKIAAEQISESPAVTAGKKIQNSAK